MVGLFFENQQKTLKNHSKERSSVNHLLLNGLPCLNWLSQLVRSVGLRECAGKKLCLDDFDTLSLPVLPKDNRSCENLFSEIELRIPQHFLASFELLFFIRGAQYRLLTSLAFLMIFSFRSAFIFLISTVESPVNFLRQKVEVVTCPSSDASAGVDDFQQSLTCLQIVLSLNYLLREGDSCILAGGELEGQTLSRDGQLIHGRRLRIRRGRIYFYNRRFCPNYQSPRHPKSKKIKIPLNHSSTFHIFLEQSKADPQELTPLTLQLFQFLKEHTMGLDYLNKKVWHPGSMKNIQKVWEVEQIQKEINKKRREREKKLLQEQHNDELKRIQVEAGLIPRSHLDRMEWMYDWGNKIGQQKTNQEFLTGQKVANLGESKESKHVFQEEITNRKCEDFQLLHEDPMFEIMKQEKARKDAIVNNPIQMRNIIKEVEREYLPEDLDERRKKHMSSIRRKSTSSSSSSSSSSRERRRKHKKDKHRHKHRRERSPFEEEERSRSREQSSKKSYKQSKLFKDYIRDRFGGIAKEDETGNVRPDYSMHKKKYKTQIQLDEQDRKYRLEKMRENAKKLEALREGARKKSQSEQRPRDYQGGIAKIRGDMLNVVKENRNHRRYKGSDSE